jgi:hypothetical protein
LGKIARGFRFKNGLRSLKSQSEAANLSDIVDLRWLKSCDVDGAAILVDHYQP